jgi:PAS domain-containing protein
VALAGARLGVRELDLVTGRGSWTPEAAAILGRANGADASFDAWLAAVHPDDQAAVLASWQHAQMDAENYHEVEYRFRQQDGSWRWIAAYGRVVFEGERPVRVITVVQDISARKRIEAELRENETRLRLAREAAGFGIWDRDLLTGESLWSPDEWRLWGLSPRPGAPSVAEWATIVHPEDRARRVAAWSALLHDTPREADAGFRVVRPDGQVRWLQQKATLIRNAQGSLTRIVGITLDVTSSHEVPDGLRRLSMELRARMETEVAAREAAQARAAHAERVHALGQLAGGIAHDFNNVLQTVSSAITLITQRPDDQASLRRLLDMADAATRRGAAVTRRLLAFTRRNKLEAETIAADALLHDLHEILVHTLGPGIDIAVQPAPAPAPFVADRSQLETVLINLATNARDAMPHGGSLILSAAAETVPDDAPPDAAGLAPGRYIRLAVADDGIGMDAVT